MYNVYQMVMVVAVVFCSRLAFCRFSSRREALWIILPAGIANRKKLGILFARRLIFLCPPLYWVQYALSFCDIVAFIALMKVNFGIEELVTYG